MADEKDEDVFHVDDEPTKEAEAPKVEEPVVVVPAAPAEPAITFPEGTTAKDIALELITLREVQQGIGQSYLPEHLKGINKVTALKRYEQICEVLAKIAIE